MLIFFGTPRWSTGLPVLVYGIYSVFVTTRDRSITWAAGVGLSVVLFYLGIIDPWQQSHPWRWWEGGARPKPNVLIGLLIPMVILVLCVWMTDRGRAPEIERAVDQPIGWPDRLGSYIRSIPTWHPVYSIPLFAVAATWALSSGGPFLLLRTCLCVISGYYILNARKWAPGHLDAVLLVTLVVLNNPIVPINLGRQSSDVWNMLDVAACVYFVLISIRFAVRNRSDF